MRWPRTRYMFTSVWTCACFSRLAASVSTGLMSGRHRAGSYGSAIVRKTSS